MPITIMRYHYTLPKKVSFNRIASIGVIVEQDKYHPFFWWECTSVATTLENRNYLVKLKISKFFDLEIPLLSMYYRKTFSVITRDLCKNIHKCMVHNS